MINFIATPPLFQKVVPYLLLVAAAAAAYANIYSNHLLFEDQILITNNQYLRDWNHLYELLTQTNHAGAGDVNGGFHRPLQGMLYLFVYQMFGSSAAAFHALHFVIHSINICLVYRLGKKLGFATEGVFTAALLWGLHPFHALDISFMSSTGEILWSLFALLGLATLLPDFSPQKIGLAAFCFLLAAASKETAIVFPALATLCLFVVSKERLKLSAYMKTWPLWLLSLIVALVFMAYGNLLHVEQSEWAANLDLFKSSLFIRLFTSLSTLPAYFGRMMWPSKLYFPLAYPVALSFWSWPVVTGALIVLAALAQLIWGKGKRGIALTFGLLWFAVAFAPYTSIIVPINFLFSEAWMYMPSIGLFLGIAQTIAVWVRTSKSKQVRYAVASIAVAAALSLGIRTHFQNSVYHDEGAYWENSLRCGEDFIIWHNNLGAYYLSKNEFDKAIEQFHLVIAHPDFGSYPHKAGMYLNLAMATLRVVSDENGRTTTDDLKAVLPQSQHIPEAVDALHKSIAIDPHPPLADMFLKMIQDYQSQK